jgi:hypothetical protein
VTVVMAFVLTSGSGTSPSKATAQASTAVTVPAPAHSDQTTETACITVFEKVPVQLGTLTPRRTATDSSFVAAWGDPPIVLRCGVDRPAILNTAEAAQLIDVNGVLWQPDPQSDRTVYTAVDRRVYVEVTVPAGQDQPLTDLAPAVAALPAICTASNAVGQSTAGLPICK